MTVITKKYYDSSECIWIEEKNTDGSENEKFEPCIKGKLKSALQMPNIMVLAGSGTSLGDVVNGPRMWDLWEACTTNDMLTIANECFSESGFDSGLKSNQNIEICLSHCEAYLQVGASINKTTLIY